MSNNGIYIGHKGLCIGENNAFTVDVTGDVNILKSFNVEIKDANQSHIILLDNSNNGIMINAKETLLRNKDNQIHLTPQEIRLEKLAEYVQVAYNGITIYGDADTANKYVIDQTGIKRWRWSSNPAKWYVEKTLVDFQS